MIRALLLTALVALAACGADPIRYEVPRVEAAARVSVPYAGIEVKEVSLPTYAALEEISVQQPDGTLASDASLLWADDPARAVTLDLTRNLARITGRKVASEPWPFRSIPDVSVDVRIERIVADTSGTFRLSGQYFVAPDNTPGPERSAVFDLAVPFAADGGLAAIAAARASAVAQLAEVIARNGLR